MVGSLVGALAGGSLLGLVLGILAPAGPDLGTDNAAAAGSTHSASATATTTTTSASRSASPSKTKPIKTVTLSPAAVPNDFIQHPENDRTMMLGTLQSIDHNDPNNILIYVTKATLLTGAKARQFLQNQQNQGQNQGQQPASTAVAPVDGAQPQQLRLERDAALWGQFVLGDGQNQNLHRFGSIDEFLGTADGVLGQNRHPALWIKRTLGVEGPVIYLAEQYPA